MLHDPLVKSGAYAVVVGLKDEFEVVIERQVTVPGALVAHLDALAVDKLYENAEFSFFLHGHGEITT